MIRTTVMLKADTHKALWAISKKEDRPFSRVVRSVLEDYVEATEAEAGTAA